MGIGSSQERYKPRTGRRSSPPNYGKHGKKKRRRGFFGRIRPSPTTKPIIPIKYHPHHHRYPYGYRPYGFSMPAYAPVPPPPPVYPGYMPMPYNNYAIPPYGLPQQSYMTPQQLQAMAMQQAMMMPNSVPYSQPMPMPQQGAPPMFSPYMSSPYSMGAPMSAPYFQQQQPQVLPNYNYMRASAPVSTGMISPVPYSSPYQATNAKLSTDWTGGGKISPGFLGPPI